MQGELIEGPVSLRRDRPKMAKSLIHYFVLTGEYPIIKRISQSFLTILALLCLSSCVPLENEKNSRSRSQASMETPDETNDFAETPDSQSGQELYWFLEGQRVNGPAIVNESIKTVIYLRGDAVHRYLVNHQVPHCIVFNYLIQGQRKQLRSRAIPITYTSPGSTNTERLFRIDIASKLENSDMCSGTAPWLTSSREEITNLTPPTDVSFFPPELCSNCSGIISSESITLHRESISPMTLLETFELNTTGLQLRIDISNNASTPSTSCTNSECRAQGFDCCLDGQCVNDGSLRSGVDTNSELYLQALSEIDQNPMAFVNYPEVFFVCSESIGTPPPSTSPTNPEDEVRERLNKLKSEYWCLEEGKSSSPNYGLGECSDSSITNRTICEDSGSAWTPYCRVGICSNKLFNNKTSCESNGHSWESYYPESNNIINGTLEAYEVVRGNIWRRCGCQADPFPSHPEEPHCPNFGLKAIMNSFNQIEDIVCLVPDPDLEPPPFQDLTVSISARSAPHRFFDEEGKLYDSLDNLYNSNILQEGEEFLYGDEGTKSFPNKTTFSMNAILGQMNVQLNRAKPAQMINVDFDQAYIISTTSGMYTPCPMCASDSWFQAFRPFPSSQNGRGLQASGFSTARNQYENNFKLGNYEDTIFGRACWVPPTMLPFTHMARPDVQDQRLRRLRTQAALYINGYQRDWFGFNLGALIGSFDGVSWFAIGNGRRVVAQSNKLFLAINAPFADLADASSINVSVVQDLGGNVAANYDFDPDFNLDHPRQNQGGTCQANHYCEVDSDCVTRLGWEYTCVDVNRYQTKWPRFDINGNERAEMEHNFNSLTQILNGGMNLSEGTKRCVYRGRGAPCKRDWSVGTNNNEQIAKAFRCAPNFYCASLEQGYGYNQELVREPAGPFSVLFGQDANVLGRPKDYVGAPHSLITDDFEIIQNLIHNMGMTFSDPSEMGLCLPGKRLANDLIEQHRNDDVQNRTDYISQISGCLSSAEGLDRYMSCPLFDEDGNYDYNLSANNDQFMRLQRSFQNMCGAESKRTLPSNGDIVSTFADIEANPIATLGNLVEPKVARDACLRRAGSVCHTNLDCGPNELHSTQAMTRGPADFGSTMAEKKYWEEALICGQAQTPPPPTSPAAQEFDMTQNRCCRPVGENFTMYTELSRMNTVTSSTSNILPGDVTPVSSATENIPLRTFSTPLNTSTGQLGRYSRYRGIPLFDADQSDLSGLNIWAQAPMIHIDEGTGDVMAPKIFQWKAINDTGRQNCCGGGWIRRFADGTNNWENTQRLQISPENFECINQVWTFNDEVPGGVSSQNWNYDRTLLCLSPAEDGCIQANMELTDTFQITNPSLGLDTAILSTLPINENSPFVQEKSMYAPYQPRRYINLDEVPEEYRNFNFAFWDGFNYSPDPMVYIEEVHGFSIYLPLYISVDNIISVRAQYIDSNGSTRPTDTLTEAAICDIPRNPGLDLADNEYCFENVDDYIIMHIATNSSHFYGEEENWDYIMAGVEIEYNVFGFGDTANHPPNMLPGNPLYYTSKLARLELLGIPQIVYEPIYCSNDRDRLVPNIFRSSNRTAFESSPNTFSYDHGDSYGEPLNWIYDPTSSLIDTHANPDRITATHDEVQLPHIFSEEEFTCCIELGKNTTEASKCCSGFAMPDEEEVLTCALPRATNLNVYFNKFVSSEGMRDDLDTKLTDTDFIPETGEPKFNESVYSKLTTLGRKFCESGRVRRGGSSGFFFPKPNNGFFEHQSDQVDQEDVVFLGLIDSNQDFDESTGAGYFEFVSGYRWTHQLYCE